MVKNARMQIVAAVASLLVAALVLSSATYAWFTFSASTNVEPMEGGVGYGDGNLLISNAFDGPYAESCDLPAVGEGLRLQPISTANLYSFFSAREHDKNGITTAFVRKDAIDDIAVCGTVYLKSEGADNAIYFNRNALSFGEDMQALAAMRLGIVISDEAGDRKYIFRLDALGDTSQAAAQQTVEQPGMVVFDADDTGKPVFYPDPALDIAAYCAKETDDPEYPAPGENMLCLLRGEDVARVDYYLYLEGCDENCINEVQGRDLALALGFTGTIVENAP